MQSFIDRPLWYTLDEQKRPVPVYDYRNMPDRENFRVGKTLLPNGFWVSTVFLSVDHCWDGGKPILFETMVFDRMFDRTEMGMDRYCEWSEAEEGHKKMVAKWRFRSPWRIPMFGVFVLLTMIRVLFFSMFKKKK